MTALLAIKGKRPIFTGEAASDDILAIVMTVAQELAVLKERCDTYERLLVDNNILGPKDFEDYRPSDAVTAERETWRRDYLDRILWIVKNRAENESRSKDAAD